MSEVQTAEERTFRGLFWRVWCGSFVKRRQRVGRTKCTTHFELRTPLRGRSLKQHEVGARRGVIYGGSGDSETWRASCPCRVTSPRPWTFTVLGWTCPRRRASQTGIGWIPGSWAASATGHCSPNLLFVLNQSSQLVTVLSPEPDCIPAEQYPKLCTSRSTDTL